MCTQMVHIHFTLYMNAPVPVNVKYLHVKPFFFKIWVLYSVLRLGAWSKKTHTCVGDVGAVRARSMEVSRGQPNGQCIHTCAPHGAHSCRKSLLFLLLLVTVYTA